MEIKVYVSLDNYNRRKACYCNRLDVTKGMEIDFGLLLRAMRVLYGSSCIVEFLVVG